MDFSLISQEAEWDAASLAAGHLEHDVACGLTGVHALPLNRRWVEIIAENAAGGLDQSLAGLKLVQISDLHYSPVVWRISVQFIRW